MPAGGGSYLNRAAGRYSDSSRYDAYHAGRPRECWVYRHLQSLNARHAGIRLLMRLRERVPRAQRKSQ